MAGYGPYELLRVLIERVGWPSEGERNVALASVDEMERMSLFGNLAQMMQCQHRPDNVISTGYMGSRRCLECGRLIA